MSQTTLQEKDSGNNSNVIKNVYGGLISTLNTFVLDIKRSMVLFLVCISLTTGLLVLNSTSKKDYYKSSFTVSYDDLVRKIYGDRLAKINTLVQNKDFNKVASLLGTSNVTSAALIKVQGSNILGQDLDEDMNTDRIPFVVTLTVKDSSAISKLQNGIVMFLESGNAYMAEKKVIKIKEVDEELQFINQQLQMMDSLKKKYNENSFSVSELKLQNSSASTIYQFSYELYKRKQELLRKQSMPSNVQVLDDAIVPKRVAMPMIISIFIGLIGGTFLYCIMKYFVIPVFRGRID